MLGKLKAIAGLFVFVLAAGILLEAAFLLIDARDGASKSRIVIGSKADTEGLLLAEIMAQLIERRTGLPVVRRTQLGGTQVCFKALLAGEIDVYPEYTGTALMALLNAKPMRDNAQTLALVQRELHERFGVLLLEPLAFNNTYALAMTRRKAAALGVSSISELTRHPALRAGFTAEFSSRRDGYEGLREFYGLHFVDPPVTLEAGLMYDAVASAQVDVIDAYATDGRIEKLDLLLLKDDRNFFPRYQAAPLLAETEHRGQIKEALQVLAGRLSDAEMRKLNAAVDIERRTPNSVAREYVEQLR